MKEIYFIISNNEMGSSIVGVFEAKEDIPQEMLGGYNERRYIKSVKMWVKGEYQNRTIYKVICEKEGWSAPCDDLPEVINYLHECEEDMGAKYQIMDMRVSKENKHIIEIIVERGGMECQH